MQRKGEDRRMKRETGEIEQRGWEWREAEIGGKRRDSRGEGRRWEVDNCDFSY